MEGVPGPNVYSVPATVGFVGHTVTKRRLPSVSIGQKRNEEPAYDHHGLMYDLRDQTRFGKTHRPNNGFTNRGLEFQVFKEPSPAPNHYLPNMDSVKPKAPRVSFQGRTTFGRIEQCQPGPNAYNLRQTVKPKKKTTTRKTFAQRFKCGDEDGPAPNVYHLPATDTYKYGRAANAVAPPVQNSEVSQDIVPPPNAYYPRTAGGPAKTFGQKPSYKRITYMTVQDNMY